MSFELKAWLIFFLMFGSFSLLWCIVTLLRQYRRIKELETELELTSWLLWQEKPFDPENWWKDT